MVSVSSVDPKSAIGIPDSAALRQTSHISVGPKTRSCSGAPSARMPQTIGTPSGTFMSEPRSAAARTSSRDASIVECTLTAQMYAECPSAEARTISRVAFARPATANGTPRTDTEVNDPKDIRTPSHDVDYLQLNDKFHPNSRASRLKQKHQRTTRSARDAAHRTNSVRLLTVRTKAHPLIGRLPT